MTKLSARSIWQLSGKRLSDVLDRPPFTVKKRKIHFYAPSFMYYKMSRFCSSTVDFPTISVTGKGCALRCKHCGGLVLDTMYPATSPDALLKLCTQLQRKGAVGCLISGGCLPNGTVPLGQFVDAISSLKRELGLTIFVHTGVIDTATAESLKEAGVDAALIDIIGSNETIRKIYNLDISVEDYSKSLRVLNKAKIDFVPHVIVGLHYGRLKGELNALQMISKYEPSALVIIAFMPIRGTEMEKVTPPTPIDMARVVAMGRLEFPKTPLVLGCMRAKDRYRAETEILAIKAGVDAMAFPTEEAVRFAESLEYEVSFSSYCCAQIYMDMRD